MKKSVIFNHLQQACHLQLNIKTLKKINIIHKPIIRE
jgi:hypothetical protein